MQLGRVCGQIVSTRKASKLEGFKILVVQPISLETFEEKGAPFVSLDTVGAGDGEVVMVVAGSSARQTAATDARPTDSSIIAIIDSVDIDGVRRFEKHTGILPVEEPEEAEPQPQAAPPAEEPAAPRQQTLAETAPAEKSAGEEPAEEPTAEGPPPEEPPASAEAPAAEVEVASFVQKEEAAPRRGRGARQKSTDAGEQADQAAADVEKMLADIESALDGKKTAPPEAKKTPAPQKRAPGRRPAADKKEIDTKLARLAEQPEKKETPTRRRGRPAKNENRES